MHIAIIAVLAAVGFGVVSIISAFIRHLLMSRDKKLNEEALKGVVNQEKQDMEEMREEMLSYKRFKNHYALLGDNKEAIHEIDTNIENLIQKKLKLIHEYSIKSIDHSNDIISREVKMSFSDDPILLLKKDVDLQIEYFDSEIKALQERRSTLWNIDHEYQNLLMKEENKRNENLDKMYDNHSKLIGKVYLKHIDYVDEYAKENVRSSTKTFLDSFLAPFRFLAAFYNGKVDHAESRSDQEQDKRGDVSDVEDDINDTPKNDDVDISIHYRKNPHRKKFPKTYGNEGNMYI